MSVEDMTMTREVMRDISRHPVDASSLKVQVTRGVLYLGGTLARVRGGYDNDTPEEVLKIILRALRQKPGIREIVCEVEFAMPSIAERMMPKSKRAKY